MTLSALPLVALTVSATSVAVDKEVYALVKELRDLPGALPKGKCTPCNDVSKIGAERRSQIYDRLNELGSAAVPALARMLQQSLRNPDKDLTNTVLWIFGGPSIPAGLSGRPSSRDREPRVQTDISAALPALILTLDHPDSGIRTAAAADIFLIGPKAVAAVPKLVALLDDAEWGVRMAACQGLKGIGPLPELRKARFNPNPHKSQAAQHAVTSIETKCFGADPAAADGSTRAYWDSRCRAPPFGDTPSAYAAFVKPYFSISLGPVKRLLGDMCNLKTNPSVRHGFYNHLPDLSDEDIGRLGTVALAEKELTAIVKPWPCPKRSEIIIETGIPCPEVDNAPGALFLCFQPDGNCQRIPLTPSTPIHSLSECSRLGKFLSQTNGDPFGSTGRFVVQGAGAWYECRKETGYDVSKARH